MFEKKSQNKISPDDSLGVFKPSKGSAKVIIGDGVKIIGDNTFQNFNNLTSVIIPDSLSIFL